MSNTSKQKIPVCAYCRVSTNTKDQLNSFENQQLYFKREISKRDDWELVEIYADKGLTGTSMKKRKEFLRMLYDAGVDWEIYKDDIALSISDREPKFKRILVSNTSRFARNILAVAALRRLRQKGVYIDFLDSGKSSENVVDEAFIEMLITFAEQESRDKSIKVRFGQLESAKKGVIFTNKRIYGYKYIPDENRLEIIPEEAKVIQTIFNLYVSGEGIRRIINYLDEKGIKTRNGKRFAKSTISKILGQEKYCGDLIRNRLTTGEFLYEYSSHKVRPKEEWEIHEGVIPAIIDKETFLKVQEIRNGKIHTQQQRGINKGRSDFAGKIKCRSCGANYIRNADRGKPFYNCSTKKTRGTKACSSPNISEKRILEVISETKPKIVELITNNKENAILLLNQLKGHLLDRIDKDMSKLVEKLRTQVEILEEKKSKLLDLYLDGEFDKEILQKRTIEIEKQLASLNSQIKEYSKSNDEIYNEINKVNQNIESIKNLEIKDYSDEELKEMLRFEVHKSKINNSYYLFVTIDSFSEIQYNKEILKQYNEFLVVNQLKHGVIMSIK